MLRADHSSRGIPPTLLRRCVWSRNLVTEEGLVHWGDCCAKINLKTRGKHVVSE